MSASFQPFAVEQYLSEHEHRVRFNFSESGVHPLSYSELFELAEIDTDQLFAQRLDYPQVNGFESLREEIAARYENATADNVLVTVGASEANGLVASRLLQTGDNLVRFVPTYEQLSGTAHNLGFEVRDVEFQEERQWEVRTALLHAAVDRRTRILHVVNPNNPTGQVLCPADRRAIIGCAGRFGTWIVADEVYIGTERTTDEPTRSFWGETERIIVINSMSKAYGLPGLRLGWIVAPKEIISACWRQHEYAVIAASHFSMRVAESALRSPACDRLQARARRLIREGFDILQQALDVHPGAFSVVPPAASAVSFVKCNLPVSAEQLAARLLQEEEEVLVIPGTKFGMPDHFRIGSALEQAYLREGLERFNRVVGRILAER